MYSWDDLRYFAAAVRSGSFTAASKRLHVDTATVGRRVLRLETALKATLLVRSRTGIELTSEGQRLLRTVQELERTLSNAEQSRDGNAMSGCVRISAPEIIGAAILAPELPKLLLTHQSLSVELVPSTAILSPYKREVDIAITLEQSENSKLTEDYLVDSELGLYTSTSYLERIREPVVLEDLREADWISYVEDLLVPPYRNYMEEVLPAIRPRLSSSSMRGQREMLVAGGGVGILPIYLGGGLVRLFEDQVKINRQLWMSSHSDVAELSRVRRVRAWVRDLMKSKASIFSSSNASDGGPVTATLFGIS